jgi:hypothetical protein
MDQSKHAMSLLAVDNDALIITALFAALIPGRENGAARREGA